MKFKILLLTLIMFFAFMILPKVNSPGENSSFDDSTIVNVSEVEYPEVIESRTVISVFKENVFVKFNKLFSTVGDLKIASVNTSSPIWSVKNKIKDTGKIKQLMIKQLNIKRIIVYNYKSKFRHT